MDQGGATRWTKGGPLVGPRGGGATWTINQLQNNTKKWIATTTTSSSKVFFHVTMAGELY